MAKQELEAAILDIGLSIKAEFIPFSQSRNAAERSPSLNWRVTLSRRRSNHDPEREAPIMATAKILTTDYMSGCGQAPSYKPRQSVDGAEAVKWECEHGYKALPMSSTGSFAKTGNPLMPETSDVVYSLIQDSDVLDYDSFEAWATNIGYDVDSRAAEKTYQACLVIALKLRNGLGENNLTKLREASQNY